MSQAGDVFIVDDNPNNLGLLTGILRGAGYGVRMANNGRRALAAVRAHPPELILLDINMPDIAGYAVCEQLKSDERTRDIPIIFLSALDDVQDKVSAFRAGGVDYVTKPFQAEEVLARVESQLGLARMRRTLQQKNQELARTVEQLARAWRDADLIFSTLSDVLPGAVLDGRYRLERKIGTGGFAAVYQAVDMRDGRPVAVKVLRPLPGGEGDRQRQRLLQEGASADRVSHPSAVAVLDGGTTETGIAYLVMELLEGSTLADELRARGPLPLERCLEIFAPVCAVLEEAHAAGVIHRDVKPANIFLHRENGRVVVKLVDFGIAKLSGHAEVGEITSVGRLLGTPVYMSPERLLGQPYDGRADVYALAMTLYEALSGRLPFDLPQGSLGSLILACVNEAPLPLRRARPDVPAAVDAVVMRALAKHPSDRPTVREFAAELAAAATPRAPSGGEGAPTLDAPRPPPLPNGAKPRG